MRNDRERLLDIIESIERIEKYASRGAEAFRADELIQTWVVHHIQIIGEAARGLTEAFVAEHAQVPWPKIVAMRNILVHQYFGIDKELVWQVVNKDLTELKQQVLAILRDLPRGG
jgi:uncharacterized protein with HEPN domain